MSYRLAKPYYVSREDNAGDIFSYFRKSFNSSNPNTDGLISITASSTYETNAEYRSDVSCLIRENDNKRWHSAHGISGSNFTIDFHSNRIHLESYEISTHYNYRFILSWDLYGVKDDKMILIDKVKNQSKIEKKGTDCNSKYNATAAFDCAYPGTFSKFIMISAGVDSCNEDILSLSRIMFYGFVNKKGLTCKQITRHSTVHLSYMILFIVYKI